MVHALLVSSNREIIIFVNFFSQQLILLNLQNLLKYLAVIAAKE